MQFSSSFRTDNSKKVDFRSKEFSSISSINPPNSEYYSLSKNNIQSLLNSQSNPSVTHLDLSNNLVESIDESIHNHRELIHLNLSSNFITKIQNLNISSLKVLDLSNNKISVIENLENLIKLESLDLQNNRIHSLFLLSPLKLLSSLNISYNPLFDFSFENLFPNLTSLTLDHCFLDSFQSINMFKQLRKLSLSHNKISEDIIIELPLLEYLNISYNKITTLQSFVNLVSLKFLDISYNSISDSAFSIQSKIDSLITLNVSGTLITNPLFVLYIFPYIQSCEFSNTSITDFQLMLNFIQKTNSLSSLDLRNTIFTKELYFDNENYDSIEEYDRKYPKNIDERHKYRSSILKLKNIATLDGISTIYEINYEENVKKIILILQNLCEEQNELRKALNMPPISTSFISSLNNLSEINEYIEKISNENKKLKLMIDERQATASSKQELEKLIQENKELHKKLNHSYFTQFNNENNISKLILLYKEANEALLKEIEQQKSTIIFKKKRRLREYVINRCQYGLLQIARTKTDLKKQAPLSKESEEFLMIEGWISAKMFTRIKLKSAMKNVVYDKMTECEKTMHWMTLVVDTGSNSMDIFQSGMAKQMIVADHMYHIESKLKKKKEAIFLICAFDNGKVVVELDHKSQLPDISRYIGKYDSLLFHWKHNQYFYSISSNRVIPLYVVHIVSSTEQI
ncbi:hypothetical protein M9Y10_009871 [Tritrichomonas musculus]|uniref:Uncharacterized protein n=1 Tax=Tritrichomonas musculus TaxID=1915356 RepID=A0ABR2IR78_9EUKA